MITVHRFIISTSALASEDVLTDGTAGILHPGEAGHSIFLKLLHKSSPKLSEELHNKRGIKPFSIGFQRDGDDISFRLSVFDDRVSEAIGRILLEYSSKGRTIVFMGKRCGVSLPEGPIKSTDFVDVFSESNPEREIHLRFLSPTSFRQRGNRQFIFPVPELVFGSLLRKWNEFSPLKLRIDGDTLDAVMVSSYDLSTRTERFSDAPIKGFVGRVSYSLTRLSHQNRKIISALANFARFGGVGYKTTMGMGQTIKI